VVTDWKTASKKEDLRPRITLLDEASGETARYLLAVDAVLSVADGQDVSAGDVLARIPREAAKTRDITGGLPRVAELFEARIPKDNAIIARIDGRVEFGKDYKTKRRINIRPEDGGDLAEYLVPKGKHVAVQEGDFVRGYSFQGGALQSGWTAAKRAAGIGADYKAKTREVGPWRMVFVGFAESLPRVTNRLTLDPVKLDPQGLSGSVVALRPGATGLPEPRFSRFPRMAHSS
jgi:ribosomal protein L27